tara:strand:+ start:207 stop:407 length:201 start_codon:yes stop_codon:yes gene_type:complete
MQTLRHMVDRSYTPAAQTRARAMAAQAVLTSTLISLHMLKAGDYVGFTAMVSCAIALGRLAMGGAK